MEYTEVISNGISPRIKKGGDGKNSIETSSFSLITNILISKGG